MKVPRLALTTTEDRIASLSPEVERLGLEPVSLPCIEFHPAEEETLETARRLTSESDWLVVTSARVVAVLWPNGGLPDVSVAAVGPATAAAVAAAGGTTRVSTESGAHELSRALIPHVQNQVVFFPHAAGADLEHSASLESVTRRLESLVVYEARPLAPAPDRVDAVAFGSPTAVDGWSRSRALGGLMVGAIGTTTAQALAGHGVSAPLVPQQPSFHRLIGLIAEGLRERSVP